jgi:hypothetical protein
MTPSTRSARSFMRGRHLPTNERKDNALLAFNKKAKKDASFAYASARKELAQQGIHPGLTLNGVQLLTYLKVAAKTLLTYGFSPFGSPKYKHLHPTKGYRTLPL